MFKSRFLTAMLIAGMLCTTLLMGNAKRAWGATEPGVAASIREFGSACLEDTKYVLIAPARWERKDWAKAAGVLGATLVLYQYDQEIRDHVQNQKSETGTDFSRYLDKMGNPLYLGSMLGIWYLGAKNCKNTKAQEAALVSLESMLIADGLTVIPKCAFQRSRPYTGEGSRSFDGPGFGGDDRYSFPSGHSSSAFAVATVVADYYREKRWVPVTAYSTATLVALSRVYDDQHWSSDVFIGSLLGYSTARLVLRRQKERAGGTSSVTVVPLATSQGTGLALQYRF